MSVPTPSLAAHFVMFDRDSECTQVTCLASIPHATSVPYSASCMLACLLRKHANLLCVQRPGVVCSSCPQVVLPGPWSNLTMFSLVLENLPYGDAASLQEAEGNSIVLSNRLWPIRYKRCGQTGAV